MPCCERKHQLLADNCRCTHVVIRLSPENDPAKTVVKLFTSWLLHPPGWSDRPCCRQRFFGAGRPTPATDRHTLQQKQDMQLSDDYTGGQNPPPPSTMRAGKNPCADIAQYRLPLVRRTKAKGCRPRDGFVIMLWRH